MSTLTVIDRRYLEKFLGMGSGYVLELLGQDYWRVLQQPFD